MASIRTQRSRTLRAASHSNASCRARMTFALRTWASGHRGKKTSGCRAENLRRSLCAYPPAHQKTSPLNLRHRRHRLRKSPLPQSLSAPLHTNLAFDRVLYPEYVGNETSEPFRRTVLISIMTVRVGGCVAGTTASRGAGARFQPVQAHPVGVPLLTPR
jgi:hypothetical protein